MGVAIANEVVIDAAPGDVWKVFADFTAYPQWTPFLRFDAASSNELREGSTFGVQIKLGNDAPNAFKPLLLKNVPASEFRWQGRILSSSLLFVGEHYFTLTPVAGPGGKQQTRLVHGETFKGCLVPLLGGVVKQAAKDQAAFSQALKARVEGAEAAKH